MTRISVALHASVFVFALAGAGMPIAASTAQEPAAEAVIASAEAVAASDSASHRALLDRYCVTCHNEGMVNGRGRAASPLVGQLRAVGLTLDTLDLAEVGSHADAWEKVVRKLRGGVMPPAGARGRMRSSSRRS